MKDTKLSVDTGTFVRFWLVILGFIAAIGAIWLSRGTLMLIAISFFLALILNRPVSWIARHLPGKSRVFATLISYLMIVAVVVLVFFNVVPIFVSQISHFVGQIPDMLHNLQNNSGWLTEFLDKYNLTNQYNDWLKDMQKEIGAIAANIGGSFVGALSGLVNVIINVIFVSILTFLMLVEAPVWEEKFWRLIYSDAKKREYHQNIARKMYNVVGDYISGQITVAIISASLTAIAVVVLGLIFKFDITLFWPAWTVIFIMTFIPMFGALIGGTIAGLLILLYSWPAAIIYWVFFIIEQQIENNMISPHIQSKKLNMSALVVLIAILLGLQVGGLLGALVAIPVAGCVMVLAREYIRNRHVRLSEKNGEKDFDPNNEVAVETVLGEKRDYIKISLPRISILRSKRSKRK